MRVGLEAIAFAVPQHYVDMTDLAEARGIDPKKLTKGLGQEQMAVATPCEDAVTLAATAALRVIERFGIDPASIGSLIVGTETGVDHSKPVAIYVHELLGLESTCRTFEVKHACYAAMAGLSMSTDWVLSGRARGRKALVVATDIARYAIGSPGEPTQGAGAVAAIVSDTPTLLELHADLEGTFAKQVMDFWRPIYRKTALVDGHYSIGCYLDALAGAYEDHQAAAAALGWPGKAPSSPRYGDRFEACLYHAPFVKMAKKAHQRLWEVDRGAALERGTEAHRAFELDHARRVAPYLELSARVGNIYTGSLFLGMLNLLEARASAPGLPISLFSYGSGCAAAFTSATVCEEAEATLAAVPSFREDLDARTRVPVARYEAMRAASEDADHNGTAWDPAEWGVADAPFVYAGTDDHRRLYRQLAAVRGA